MASFKLVLASAPVLALLWLAPDGAHGADVRGYSVLKGFFQNQLDARTLVPDPDFAYSILASVDLTDFDLLVAADVRLPDGRTKVMDNGGDYWAFLDTRSSLLALDAAYGWGTYTIDFTTVHEGKFTCALTFPNTPLPPTLRMVNFADVQAVNPYYPLRVDWDYSAPPLGSDFVQVYVDLGHDTVFATPDSGQPGALDGTARSVTIPAGTLDPGFDYSLNLEITRVVATNATSYAGVTGAAGRFNSTSVTLETLMLPQLGLPLPPTNGMISVEVWAEPNKSIVLQGSENCRFWNNLATNATLSGTNLFSVPTSQVNARFFRAWQP